MKRALKLLPADLEKIDQIRPFRLSDDDLKKFLISLAGFEFIAIGGVLLCPECGQPQKLEAQVAMDMEVYWFLKFYCLHYGKDSVAVPSEVLPPVEPQQPQQ